jgi:hypothetical protein
MRDRITGCAAVVQCMENAGDTALKTRRGWRRSAHSAGANRPGRAKTGGHFSARQKNKSVL